MCLSVNNDDDVVAVEGSEIAELRGKILHNPDSHSLPCFRMHFKISGRIELAAVISQCYGDLAIYDEQSEVTADRIEFLAFSVEYHIASHFLDEKSSIQGTFGIYSMFQTELLGNISGFDNIIHRRDSEIYVVLIRSAEILRNEHPIINVFGEMPVPRDYNHQHDEKQENLTYQH